jgi:CRISPR-associated protein (TIGR02584 family)
VLHKFAVNDLDRVLSIAPDAIPYFTETYVTENVKGDTADFQELANRSVGADFIGALRMDVDNLGLIFSDGLKCLPGIAYFSTLSRNLEYFFKFYMNSICAGALLGDESRVDENFRPLDICGKRQCAPSRAVSIIYSGGDDLFLVGAWDEVTELSFDIEKSFRKLTCQNPDVSLSGGIVVKHPDYPLYLTASEAKMAEGKAKGNWDVCSECVENLADLSYSRFQCLLYRQMGETGQVITMTLNKLLERGDIIHEVIVIHTSTQDKNVKKAVEGLKDQFTRPSPDKYILFFKGERDCGADKDLIINQLKAKESSLIDENGLLNIKLTLKELDILDIRSLDDANKVQDELYACVIDQKVHQRDFVISLAGGRKTMSGADAIAAQNIGSNLLCHVTEPGGELRDRYQPPLKSYELVIMNVPNIHPLLEHAQWTSEKFKDIFDEPSTFREKLGDLSKQVRVVSWLSAQDTIHDLAKNYLLSQANFTLVNLLRNDRFPSDLADILRAVKTNVTFMIDYLRVLDNVHRQLIGKINISRLKIRVRDIVDRMLNLVQCNFAAEEEALNVKGISFQNDVEENCHIDFNEEVLKYVFFNLFTNSIKAINKRRNNNSITTGTIRVENESVGQGAVIRIIDDGIGFDGDSERFFEPYFSTEERADVPSGIGLALVRGILSQYEAKIKLSSPGIRKGCTAEISIP